MKNEKIKNGIFWGILIGLVALTFSGMFAVKYEVIKLPVREVAADSKTCKTQVKKCTTTKTKVKTQTTTSYKTKNKKGKVVTKSTQKTVTTQKKTEKCSKTSKKTACGNSNNNNSQTKKSSPKSNTKSQTKETEEKEEKKPNPACDDTYVSGHYNLEVEHRTVGNGNKVTIHIDQGVFYLEKVFKYVGDGPGDGTFAVGPDASSWVSAASSTLSASSPMNVTLNINDSNEQEEVVLRFRLKEDDVVCNTLNKVIVDVALTMNSVETTKDINDYEELLEQQGISNKYYDSWCKILREGKTEDLGDKKFSDQSIITKETMKKYDNSEEALSYYKSEFDYCFKPHVLKNKKEEKVLTKIKKVITNWYRDKVIFNVDEEVDPEFLAAFNKSKFRAGGLIDDVGCATTLQEGQQKDHCFKVEVLSSKSEQSEKTDDDDEEDTVISYETSKLDEQKLSCDANYSKSDYRTDEGYDFANLQSYYAYSEQKIDATYTYHPTGSSWDSSLDRTTLDGKVQTEEKNICKVTCEEAVDVEYGPPVASMAGLCFEYRVKVTSRVKCKTELSEDRAPNTDVTAVCQPVPNCSHYGKISNSGGPVEEFDKCINKCDGGKYTSSCSNKCYQEIYGSNPDRLAVDYADMKATKMARTTPYSWNEGNLGQFTVTGDPWNLDNEENPPHYYVTSDGTIRYAGGYALWYYKKPNYKATIEANHGKDHGYFDMEGIRRRFYSSSEVCGADCYYSACNTGYYNHDDAMYDIEANKEIYHQKMDECKAKSTCSTNVAEFTMSTNVNNDTYTFPSSGSSSLTSKGKKDMPLEGTLKACENSVTNTANGTTTDASVGSCSEDTVLYNYNGCYSGTSTGAGTLYEAEITYPGTWIKSKTQEISYVEQPGWHKENQKFCLPLNAEDVNQKWWIWHMNKVALAKESGSTYTYETNQYQCNVMDSSIKENTTYEQYTSEKPIENIHANVTDFGHFKWSFNVNCFYALYKNITPKSTTSDSNGGSSANQCNADPFNWRVRDVDDTDLFPSTDGQKIPNSSSTGRQPGFNWTQDATITEAKAATKGTFGGSSGSTSSGGGSAISGNSTSNYAVNPAELISVIQERGDKIFDDDYRYLDYSFHLTPSVLGTIRNHYKGKSYTTYEGEFLDTENYTDKYGFIPYRTNIFAHSGVSNPVITSQYVKTFGNIGCNNDGIGSSCEYAGNYIK